MMSLYHSEIKYCMYICVQAKCDFTEIGWIPMPGSVVQLCWAPKVLTTRSLLVACTPCIVLQCCFDLDLEELEVTDNYEILNMEMKLFRFKSCRFVLFIIPFGPLNTGLPRNSGLNSPESIFLTLMY